MGFLGGLSKYTHWALMLIQIGISMAVIIIPAVHLSGYDWSAAISSMDGSSSFFTNGTNSTNSTNNSNGTTTFADLYNGTSCLMGRVGGHSICTYSYIVGGATVGAIIVVALLKCLTCGCCGTEMTGLFDMVFHACGIAWWTVAAIIILKHGVAANNSDVPLMNWRNTVIALAWLGAVVFAASFLVSTFVVFACPCFCCTDSWSPGGPVNSKLYGSKRDMEKAEGAKARLTEMAKSHHKAGAPHTEQFLRI